MQRITLLTVLIFSALVSYGQNISVTFTGNGEASTIDSVTATNQRTDQRVTFPGNETLVLTLNTSIPLVSELAGRGMVFPNPFPGRATFTTVVQKPQTVYLFLQNLVGQVVAYTQAFVQSGENAFGLSLETAGVYTLTLTTGEAKSSYKIICSGTAAAENNIQYLGSISNNLNPQNNQNYPPGSTFKSLNSGYTLGYTAGDVILYRCRSGIFTTIVTDTLPTSKNYEVEFTECTDPDGKSYSIVKIGNQTWMAENLAYLPAVSHSTVGSDTTSHYFVYDYDGVNLIDAKAGSNYSTYGALYNWPAAMAACPSGWHLPSAPELITLKEYLGNLPGGKMKEPGTTHWSTPDSAANNSSGFTAIPGGQRSIGGGFYHLGITAFLWSASGMIGNPLAAEALYLDNDSVGWLNYDKNFGLSVRCIKTQIEPETLRKTEQAFPGVKGEIVEVNFRGTQTTCHKINGYYVYQGDIILDTSSLNPLKGAGLGSDVFRWPDNRIYYRIDSKIPDVERIYGAINYLEEKTNLKFIERSGEKNFVDIIWDEKGCSSYPGMVGGAQNLLLADWGTEGTVIHEMGHAIGLLHEQSRSDRDETVIILWDNIMVGHDGNFKKYESDMHSGNFDFESIMLYDSYAWSKNRKPTITKLDGTVFGCQREILAGGDIEIINQMYPESKLTDMIFDKRDGHKYAYKTIGTQTWMIENLAYLPSVSPSSAGSDTDPYYYVFDYQGSSVNGAKTKPNYAKYDVLYNWPAALTACPSGWHLPTDAEWKILETYLGMIQSDADDTGYRPSGSVGKALKFTSGWYGNGNGDNSSGFAALPGGYRSFLGDFYSLGNYAYFWSSSEYDASYAWYRYLYYYNGGVSRSLHYRGSGFSARCLQN